MTSTTNASVTFKVTIRESSLIIDAIERYANVLREQWRAIEGAHPDKEAYRRHEAQLRDIAQKLRG